ncbi:MAG: PRC-barrel domain-containing protein [Planctomycetota bacterium]
MNTLSTLTSRRLATLTLVAAASTVALRAQDHTVKSDKEAIAAQERALHYTATSKLLGAEIRMAPGAEERQEAASEGEQAKRPKAKLDEVLIDGHTGELQYAVVSFGGFIGIGDKTVLVPCKQLRWNPSMERFELNWTEDQLKAKPEFDLDEACKNGLDSSCSVDAQGNRGVAKTEEAAVEKSTKAVEGTPLAMSATRLRRASELDGYTVYANADKYGAVEDLIIDRDQHKVVLAVVSHGGTLGVGGTSLLVPFKALQLCTLEKESVLCVPGCTSKDLDGSVRYEKPKNGVVDPLAAQRALDTKLTERMNEHKRG